MPSIVRNVALALLLLAGGLAPVHADPRERPAPTGGVLSLLPAPKTTGHSLTIAGQAMRYQATAGTLSLLAGDGAVTAEIFYVSYEMSSRETPADVAQRH